MNIRLCKELFVIVFLIVISLSGCGHDNEDEVIETSSNEPILAEYDRSYDTEKVVNNYVGTPSQSCFTCIAEGVVYNQIYIYLKVKFVDEVTEENIGLISKGTFNEWLSGKTDLEFINKTIDDSINYSPWLIEFSSATKEQVESLVEDLKGDEDVYYVKYVNELLPEYDTPENRIKLKNIMFPHGSVFSEGEEFGDQNLLYGSGSWYLKYIGITGDDGLEKDIHSNGFTSNKIKVGVIDSSIHLDHEDIKECSTDNRECIGSARLTVKEQEVNLYSHGTAVSGVIRASIMGNTVGVSGITNGKLSFVSYLSDDIKSMEDGIKMLDTDGVNIINISLGSFIGYEYTYRRLRDKNEVLNLDEYLKNKSNEYAEFDNLSFLFRRIVEEHDHILFVLSAGNLLVDSKYANGVFHYDENGYSELENLIVVGANGQDNILHGYSNCGESVDITAPSGIATLGCFDEDNDKSTYKTTSSVDDYGITYEQGEYAPSLKISESEDEICSKVLKSPHFGTSFSAPIVSGVAALIWNLDPSLKPWQVKELLVKNGNVKYVTKRWGEYGVEDLDKNCSETKDNKIPILNAKSSYIRYMEGKASINDVSIFPSHEGDTIRIDDKIKFGVQVDGVSNVIELTVNGELHEMFKIGSNYYESQEFSVLSEGRFEYLISMKTRDGELIRYIGGNFTVEKQDIPPVFHDVILPSSVKIGEEIFFKGSVSDDIQLSKIQIEVTNGETNINDLEQLEGTTKDLGKYSFGSDVTEVGTYTVRLIATDNAEQTNSSAFFNVDVFEEDSEPPVISGGVYIVQQTWGFKLEWNKATGSVEKYELYRSTSDGVLDEEIYSGDKIKFNDFRVDNGITYYYKVKACNIAGCSESEQDFSMFSPEKPLISGGVNIIQQVWGFKLAWNDATGSVERYELYRSISDGVLGELLYSKNSTKYNDFRVDSGTTYYYTVKACNIAGCTSSNQDYHEFSP